MAVVPAAGQGTRMGQGTPKQYRTLGGLPLLVYSLRTLQQVDLITDIILSVPESDLDYCWEHIIAPHGLKKVTQIVKGGARRQDSVRQGLLAITKNPDVVLIHDGARPFIQEDTIRQVIEKADSVGASVVALPMQDTIKRVNDQGMIQETLNREEVWQIQTPQAFRFDLLMTGHRQAEKEGWDVTDDAALIEKMGYPVSVVRGDAWNMKITTPQDLLIGEAIIHMREKKL